MKDSPIIPDCSILAKAITQETQSDQARSLIATASRLWAPDLILIELGNVLWKKVQRGVMTEQEALEAQRSVASLSPIRILPSTPYHFRALEIALVCGTSFYDSLYLALAEQENGLLVTADERLVRRLETTAWKPYVHWIGAGVPT